MIATLQSALWIGQDRATALADFAKTPQQAEAGKKCGDVFRKEE